MQLHLKTSRIILNQHTHKLGQWLALMGASAIWTRINRYNAEVYKRRYKTFLIVLYSISNIFQGKEMNNLIHKTKLFSEKQLYGKFFNF